MKRSYNDDVPSSLDSATRTDCSKLTWKGFCEIESEPALFNEMLKTFGVREVKVQEVLSLDDDMLSLLPRPVYGLIFLYKWMDDTHELQDGCCSDSVWFANQTINGACATLALLNIVNNIPDIDLGHHLAAFKSFTKELSPADRGDAVANFEHVRRIHNSFGRHLDMMDADLATKNDLRSTSITDRDKKEGFEGETTFHFIAFMPIGTDLWKMDGLHSRPFCLGEIRDNWLGKVRPEIESKMQQRGGDKIEFAILGLVRDPLPDLLAAAKSNLELMEGLEGRLDRMLPAWRERTTQTEEVGLSPMVLAQLHLYRSDIGQHKSDGGLSQPKQSQSVDDLLMLRQNLLADQDALSTEIQEELQARQADETQAAIRKENIDTKFQRFAQIVLKNQAHDL